MALQGNTAARPMWANSTANARPRTCGLLETSAPKTALNEAGCVVSHGCSPDEYSNKTFVLNATTIRAFFLEGNSFVYAVDSLPAPTNNPCTAPSHAPARFRALGGACSSHGGASSIATDAKAIIAATIRSSPDVRCSRPMRPILHSPPLP